LVWLGDVLVSGGLGFFTAYELLKLELIPSLFIATAMTATSVGILVAVWQEANQIHSFNGEVMIDIAEMDDISAVILMALLFTVAPRLQNHPEISVLLPILGKSIGIFFLKAIIFGTFCFFFSLF
jgi:Kef-type K+ transport system membrane component KefB